MTSAVSVVVNDSILIGFKPMMGAPYMPLLKIAPITPADALKLMDDAHHLAPAKAFDFAIAVQSDGRTVGVIGMYADGKTCSLGHLWTSGEALVGSVLYGAAWRCAKSLGYDHVGL